jgi:hypothetical protein
MAVGFARKNLRRRERNKRRRKSLKKNNVRKI